MTEENPNVGNGVWCAAVQYWFLPKL